MTSVTFGAYTARVRKRYKDENLELGRFDGKHDLLRVIVQSLEKLKQGEHFIERERVLRIESCFQQDREIWGLCRSGGSGYSSSLVDLRSGSERYARRIDDAELIPLGFHFFLPKHADEGICLFQGFNRAGAKSLLSSFLAQSFQGEHEEHLIRFNPLVPEKLLTEYLEHGRVVAARFVRFSIPKDIADAYGATHDEEQGGAVELIVRAKRKGTVDIMNRIWAAARGERGVNRV